MGTSYMGLELSIGAKGAALRTICRNRGARIVEVVVNIYRKGYGSELVQQVAHLAVGKGGVVVDVQAPAHRGEGAQPVQVGEGGVVQDEQVPAHPGDVAQPVKVGESGVRVNRQVSVQRAGDAAQAVQVCEGVVVADPQPTHRSESAQPVKAGEGGVEGDLQDPAHRCEGAQSVNVGEGIVVSIWI